MNKEYDDFKTFREIFIMRKSIKLLTADFNRKSADLASLVDTIYMLGSFAKGMFLAGIGASIFWVVVAFLIQATYFPSLLTAGLIFAICSLCSVGALIAKRVSEQKLKVVEIEIDAVAKDREDCKRELAEMKEKYAAKVEDVSVTNHTVSLDSQMVMDMRKLDREIEQIYNERKSSDNDSVSLPSGDSEMIADRLSHFQYDEEKRDEVLEKYDNLRKKSKVKVRIKKKDI